MKSKKQEMIEVKQNLKKLYKIFKSTKFPFFNKVHLEKRKGSKNIFLKCNYKPLTKEFISKENIPLNNLYFTSRLYRYEKFNPKRKLKSGILKIKSLDKNHPDFQIIEKNKAEIKLGNRMNNSHNNDLYKVGTKILGSELGEYNKINNNLLNILNEKDDFEYKILFKKFSNNKSRLLSKYKNAQTNTYNSLTERISFYKFPPIKNKLLKQYFGIKINKKEY